MNFSRTNFIPPSPGAAFSLEIPAMSYESFLVDFQTFTNKKEPTKKSNRTALGSRALFDSGGGRGGLLGFQLRVCPSSWIEMHSTPDSASQPPSGETKDP